MQTYAEVVFGLFDTTAAQDAIFYSADSEPFCELSTLVDGALNELKYGTLEENQFQLDGTFAQPVEKMNGKVAGFWSMAISNDRGIFETPPTLEIVFTKPHSSVGLTFHFYDATQDWPKEIKVSWFNEKGDILRMKLFEPDAVHYIANEQVEGYQKIQIDFLKTNKPYRRVKTQKILFGAEKIFSKEDIITANLLEESDVLTNELRINTLELEVFSKDAEFSILNPKGIFASLQAQQRLDLFEYVNEEKIPMGTFYLDEWSATSETVSNFKAVSVVGLLDKKNHIGGMYNTTAGFLFAEILQGFEYHLEEELAQVPIIGYLPIGTARTALQQLAFSICAVVDCSRSNVLQIYKLRNTPSSYIPYSRKYLKETVKLRPLVTGVQVNAFVFSESEETQEIAKDVFIEGEHTIHFSQPMHSIKILGATIVEQNCNYVKILVDKESKITGTGKIYAKTIFVYQKFSEKIPPNSEENILLVDNATLISPNLAQSVAENVMQYYEQRHEYTFRMKMGTEILSDYAIIQSFNNEKFKGRIESFDIDLTGGFRADVVAVGSPIEELDKDFTGEFYTAERGMF